MMSSFGMELVKDKLNIWDGGGSDVYFQMICLLIYKIVPVPDIAYWVKDFKWIK